MKSKNIFENSLKYHKPFALSLKRVWGERGGEEGGGEDKEGEGEREICSSKDVASFSMSIIFTLLPAVHSHVYTYTDIYTNTHTHT